MAFTCARMASTPHVPAPNERNGIIRRMTTLLAIIILLAGVAPAAARIPAHQQKWQYRYQVWLPSKWYRIARCETRVNWKHNSGTYQGAFGFYHGSWDAFRPSGYPSEAYEATPWQQYQVALAIWRRYGFSGWGCRGA